MVSQLVYYLVYYFVYLYCSLCIILITHTMKIRFFLKDKNASKTEIMLTIREGKSGHNLRTLRITTGLLVAPDKWNFASIGNNRKDRQRLNTSDAKNTNDKLDIIEAKTKELATKAQVLGIEPFDYIRDHIYTGNVLSSKFAGKQKEEVRNNSRTVLDCFAEYIEVKTLTDAHGSIQIYKAVKRHLEDCLGQKAKTFIFDDITAQFQDTYIKHLYKVELTNNTIGKYLMIFKTFLHWAAKRGYHNNTEYTNLFKRSQFEREATTIALTKDEFAIIENMDLTGNERLSRVRDLFVIGCYTGMRFSDVSSLQHQHVQDGFIRLHVQKTQSTVSIPITPKLRAILDRYKEQPLPSLSNQKANAYLKELGKLAELNDTIEIVRYRGAERITEIVSKWQVLCTHTARRTFITLSLQKGMQPEVVRRVSGHKDIRSFNKYIKFADEHLQDEMLKAWS